MMMRRARVSVQASPLSVRRFMAGEDTSGSASSWLRNQLFWRVARERSEEEGDRFGLFFGDLFADLMLRHHADHVFERCDRSVMEPRSGPRDVAERRNLEEPTIGLLLRDVEAARLAPRGRRPRLGDPELLRVRPSDVLALMARRAAHLDEGRDA